MKKTIIDAIFTLINIALIVPTFYISYNSINHELVTITTGVPYWIAVALIASLIFTVLIWTVRERITER